MRLRALAPAKVNLSLFVGPARDDGRHRLVTVFESLSLYDELALETLASGRDRVVCAEVSGQNLAARALALLRRNGWEGPPVRITIAKRIPVAAGLAGGSADAAAALRLAATVAPARPETLTRVASELGADVPAQLEPGVGLGSGAGELVERLAPLAPHAFALVPVAAALSTPVVYAEADRLGLPRRLDELGRRHERLRAALSAERRVPDELLVNDLQAAAISLCPAIEPALADVRAHEPDRVLISGSGPTVVGLWWGEHARRRAEAAIAALRADHPGATVAEPARLADALPQRSL
jgi:4-diphosphocytidyl-2-C-methyl-D-erythritol kinase